MNTSETLFFCAIGGSGMMPLARIMKSRGANVRGSDRGRDQGRTPERFAHLESLGIQLFPQDGSGVTPDVARVIVSAAVEPTVPDYQAAQKQNIRLQTRAELLAEIFNQAETRIGVAGTSGKSTTTGLIGWILHHAKRQPTIVNGAAMKNFITPTDPFASAVAGNPALFVAEVDESDGSIAHFSPNIAVLNNVALDHKPLPELRELFSAFLAKANHVILNLDNEETARFAADLPAAKTLTYSLKDETADLFARNVTFRPDGVSFTVISAKDGTQTTVHLALPGDHNVSNALAAMAAALACGVPLATSAQALLFFQGIARRLDVIGTKKGVTVIDDFAHNPDKIAATLRALKKFQGRLLILFQPHGYGPLRLMRQELAACFAEGLGPDDQLAICDPLYLGGTTDKSVTSLDLVQDLQERGTPAFHAPTREDCAQKLLATAQPSDRLLIMGARDDTLPAFARNVLQRIG